MKHITEDIFAEWKKRRFVLVFVGVFEFVGLWEGKGVESGVLV